MRKRSEVRAARAAKEEPASDRSDAPPDPPPSEPAPRKPIDFPSANKPKLKRVREDLHRITETLVDMKDMHAEWKILEKGLELGEKRSEHAYAVAALDKAAGLAYRAHKLYLLARAIREEWELENEVVFSAQWTKATAELQAEKEKGIRQKQITDADVRARMAVVDPEGYQWQEKKRRELEYTVKSLERLAEIWMMKQRDYQALVGRMRG